LAKWGRAAHGEACFVGHWLGRHWTGCIAAGARWRSGALAFRRSGVLA
jgi:hypothetical protein